jgi:L-fucose isomerase-like protein
MREERMGGTVIAASPIRAGFIGFGEVNSPRELIERKCAAARQALLDLGLDLVDTPPVSDDPDRVDERRAIADLSAGDFDALVVCLAGWIPTHTVIDAITLFKRKPVILWGLAGEQIGGRLVTTADQAGTSALRQPLKALGFTFKYVYDTPEAPYRSAAKVRDFCQVAHAAARLRTAKVGMVGYRDMGLYGTLADIPSLRRVIGPDVEIVDLLEISQGMAAADRSEVDAAISYAQTGWRCDRPLTAELLEPSARLYAAVMAKARQRGWDAVSVIDVDGVKKLLRFTPAAAMMLLSDLGGLATVPENDTLGAVTQLIVRYVTGQAAAYMEFYEFMADRVLIGVPDYVPAAVVEGDVLARLTKFGQLAEGVLNVSKVRTGRVTLCRLASEGDQYVMHLATGDAVTPRPWEEAGWEPPAPQLPSLEVILDGPVEEFAQNVLSQHTIICYGDQRGQLADLCRMLGIAIL